MLGTSKSFLFAHDSSILIDETNNLYARQSYTDDSSPIIELSSLTDGHFKLYNCQATILPSSIFSILQKTESVTSIPLNTFFTNIKDLSNTVGEFNMINHIHIPTQVPTGEIIPKGSRILYPIPIQTVTQYNNNKTNEISDDGSPTIPSVFSGMPDGWRYYISDDTKLESVSAVNQVTSGFVVSYSENSNLTTTVPGEYDIKENITFKAKVSIGDFFMSTETACWFLGVNDYLQISDSSYEITYTHTDPQTRPDRGIVPRCADLNGSILIGIEYSFTLSRCLIF
jgi:hypothetical protein